MRRVVDIFVVLIVVAVVVFVVQSRPSPEDKAASVADVQHALERLYDRASYYGALDNSLETTRTLWPVAMMPEWFGDSLPANTLLPGVASESSHRVITHPRPWIDVAPPGDQSSHPPDPVAVRSDQAQFWYNPNVGLFRARVPAQLGEDEALALYNELNGVEVTQLERDTNPARTPLAYTPGNTPSATLASREPTAPEKVAPTVSSRGSRTSLFMSDSPSPKHGEQQAAEPTIEEEPARVRGRSRMKDQTPG
ncbi:hypothetical protein [Algisphaera agarilytica]|uniref:Uncharacterized protein n=1 Tax=Algisphaera agarilytica TaxID=1385975 RepID=A0A7X0LKJ7_9BACT|nr:hypothetical protein [Algisphaera agarilytica]MBB6429977.1 hypothetical protein [Algisphaera agarilytica]